MKKLLDKKIYIDVFFISIFTLTIFLFGNNDIEEYQLGLFTSQIYWKDIESFFSVFYDFYGAGTKIPIGHGPLFHPFNFLFFDLKLFYICFVFFHLFIQVYFTKRLFKLFKINYENYLLVILLIFCLPNIMYALSDDWISEFYGYCFFPLIFYYFVKIIDTQKVSAYLKFSLFFFLWIINGHIGVITTYIIFLILYFILSIKNFNHFKKIINIHLFLSLILITLLLSDYLYFLIREQSYFDSEKGYQDSYSKRAFLEIFYPIPNLLSWWPVNRLPGNPIIIYFGVISIIYIIYSSLLNFLSYNKSNSKTLIVNFLNFSHLKIQQDKIFKLSILFGLFLIFSITDVLKKTHVISGMWYSRDIFLYIGIFIYFYYFSKINLKLRKIINFFLIIYTFLFFSINIFNLYSKNENNFILDKYKNTDLIKKLKSLNLKDNDYSRIYLSPDLFPEIWQGYEEEGIFAVTDLTKYNLAPFNGYFKNVTMQGFGDEKKSMHGWINSHFDYINNVFFLDVYNIKYFLITENELDEFKNFDFVQKFKIKTNKGFLYLFQREPSNFSLNEKNYFRLANNLKSCKKIEIKCLLENESLFQLSDYTYKRLKNGIFEINNIVYNEYIILPFIFDVNWKSEIGNLSGLKKFNMFLKVNNPLVTKVKIEYKDKLRNTLKIISLTTFFMLLLYIIFFGTRHKII